MLSFFDTNILVYLFDQDAPAKQQRARQLFADEVEAGRFVASTQVLQEFYVTVTRKLAEPLTAESAEEAVATLADLNITPVDPPLIIAAIQRCRRMKISFWDALIIESAIAAGARLLLSEDLQHGRSIDGLTIENPFASLP
ncbi:PIN domain-containing protein [Geoalkalibacter sp.]|uniref:PIN domain-containing protein n=1 Tax=Geoalkalibacter sp. TaxID=3041440 RepID=UPI00272EBE77|nr:PIN domain-containing protein [Geoalkalibacter sp.]